MSETYYERDPGGPARSATLMDLLAYLLDPFCGVRKPFCWRLARLAGVTFPTARPELSPDMIYRRNVESCRQISRAFRYFYS